MIPLVNRKTVFARAKGLQNVNYSQWARTTGTSPTGPARGSPARLAARDRRVVGVMTNNPNGATSRQPRRRCGVRRQIVVAPNGGHRQRRWPGGLRARLGVPCANDTGDADKRGRRDACPPVVRHRAIGNPTTRSLAAAMGRWRTPGVPSIRTAMCPVS